MNRGRGSGDRHGGDERRHSRSRKFPLRYYLAGIADRRVWLHSNVKELAACMAIGEWRGVCGMPYTWQTKPKRSFTVLKGETR